MKGSWRDPEATAETLRNGCLHTRDLGNFDQEGYLFIIDRSQDMIITGGENIYPREVVEVLAHHPTVREASVIGVPDKQCGEAIKAVVALVTGQDVTEKELIEFCKSRIVSYKNSKSIVFVEELPKNNDAKTVKRELREAYWRGQERRI